MDAQKVRRSDRIVMEVRIEIRGSDSRGKDFAEETHTEVISRFGAAVFLKHSLVRDQEVTVRDLSKGTEGEARITGLVKQSAAGSIYGIQFLDPSLDFWGVQFPPLVESEMAEARVLLECGRCHTRVLVYIDAVEAQVLEASQNLSRPCNRCGDLSLWKVPSKRESAQPELPPPPAKPPAVPRPASRSQNKRRHARVAARLTACIRNSFWGEEVVACEDISPGGLRFKSQKPYTAGAEVTVALPFTPGGANIFVSAKVVATRPLPGENKTECRLAYIPVHKGWPGE